MVRKRVEWRGAKQGEERWHPSRETCRSDADKLSKSDEKWLVRPEWGPWAEVQDPLEEPGSLSGCRGADEDGVFQRLVSAWTTGVCCVGVGVFAWGVWHQETFSWKPLVDPAGHKVAQALEGVRACSRGVRVVVTNQPSLQVFVTENDNRDYHKLSR